MGDYARMLNASTVHWLAEHQAKLSMDLAALGSASLQAAIDTLTTDVLALDEIALPASDTTIIKTLSALADVFQVTVPDDLGLEMYVAALRCIPRPAFVRAREQLVLTHKWPRLPYPSEFIEAARPESERLASLRTVLVGMLDRCERALKMLH